MKIIVPIGISGSGKTKLYKTRYSDLALVSPDLIRKEVNGNIMDGRFSQKVIDTINARIADLVEKRESFFYDFVNVNTSKRKEFVNQFKDIDDIEIIYVVLPASVKRSSERIAKDLENKIDRANVPHKALEKQYELYQESIANNFEDENVSGIIYIKSGELD